MESSKEITKGHFVNEDREILGYDQLPDGSYEPIYQLKKGYIYSAALVTCCKCQKPILAMGGPRFTALCMDCYDKQI